MKKIIALLAVTTCMYASDNSMTTGGPKRPVMHTAQQDAKRLEDQQAAQAASDARRVQRREDRAERKEAHDAKQAERREKQEERRATQKTARIAQKTAAEKK